MKIVWADHAWDDYQFWRVSDPNVFQRLNDLIDECRKSPFKGTGKPEPLRENLSGWWSRRITVNDRLVYRISGKAPNQALEIVQCRFHY